MSDQLFDIVFRGDIIPGHQIDDVKQRLAKLFKTDKSRIDGLFCGAVVQLKRNVDSATASKYKAVLIKAGAQVERVPAGSRSQKVAPPTRRPAQNRGKHLAERLAEQVQQSEAGSAWTLSPVGESLLSDNERAQPEAVAIDTSRLSIRPLQGDLLDEDEKRRFVELELDFSGYEVAAVGTNLVNDDEVLPLPEVEIDVSDLKLAPVGSDLGEKKRQPPPPPDTSSLSIVE